jgi:hypothetical protein
MLLVLVVSVHPLLVLAMMVTGCEALEIRGSGLPPPMLSCHEHLGRCLESPLSATPGSYGSSVCVDCFDLCQKDPFGTWPWVTGSFKSCRWWDYQRWVLAPDAGPEDAHVE